VLAGERDRSVQLWAPFVGPALGLGEGLHEAEALGLGKAAQPAAPPGLARCGPAWPLTPG
jgi:hypothetical protein